MAQNPKPKTQNQEIPGLGPCPVCGRELIAGKSVNEHHLIPKTFKGKETVTLHKICHSKIHSLFTERELLQHYHTIERICAHEEIEKFVKWVRKQPADFVGRNITSNRKR